MRRGVTLAELVLVCTFLGLLVGIALPRTAAMLDGIRLRQAAHEVAASLTLARAAAIRRATYARVVVDAARNEVRVESGSDTLLRRDLRAMHRVALRASRDTITYAPSGMGYGVANSTIVVSLGARAETVTVSRLGRMRRSW
ncbi:MAG: GspH/FimT family pseudopilin [Gemmatimonadales bacterium]|nr:GspH/FimT family pseudopilin [Gemmatimonadota bacterium]MCL4213248.1 GspH/FimT family pseudopilin [Gemmatimonadales bacterium]